MHSCFALYPKGEYDLALNLETLVSTLDISCGSCRQVSVCVQVVVEKRVMVVDSLSSRRTARFVHS